MQRPAGQLDHRDTFRHSVPIRVTAYWILAGGAVLLAWLGLYPFPTVPILLLTFGLTATLVASHAAASASPRVALGYLTVEGIVQTAIFHFCGDLRLGIAPIVYTFELLNPGVRLGRAGHFAVANGFAALFASLVLAEHTSALALGSPGPWPMASVLIVVLELNVAAVFVSETRRVLEDRAVELAFARDELRAQSAELERRVSRRTAELEASYRALQAQANEHRTFVYSVTHDLKAPLNAILLRAARIDEREGTDLARESRTDLTRIAALAERGESMLRDLMAHFEVSESPEPLSDVDLGVTVRQALEPLDSDLARKGLHVDVGLLPTVRGQPKKLVHVFANLLSNAVRLVPSPGGHIAIDSRTENGDVLVCVADNGPGIPEGYERTIFNLFTRIPRPGEGQPPGSMEGTGVGLAIVRRIVEQHNGEVWVESQPGRGSRFYVRFPQRGA